MIGHFSYVILYLSEKIGCQKWNKCIFILDFYIKNIFVYVTYFISHLNWYINKPNVYIYKAKSWLF